MTKIVELLEGQCKDEYINRIYHKITYLGIDKNIKVYRP